MFSLWTEHVFRTISFITFNCLFVLRWKWKFALRSISSFAMKISREIVNVLLLTMATIPRSDWVDSQNLIVRNSLDQDGERIFFYLNFVIRRFGFFLDHRNFDRNLKLLFERIVNSHTQTLSRFESNLNGQIHEIRRQKCCARFSKNYFQTEICFCFRNHFVTRIIRRIKTERSSGVRWWQRTRRPTTASISTRFFWHIFSGITNDSIFLRTGAARIARNAQKKATKSQNSQNVHAFVHLSIYNEISINETRENLIFLQINKEKAFSSLFVQRKRIIENSAKFGEYFEQNFVENHVKQLKIQLKRTKCFSSCRTAEFLLVYSAKDVENNAEESRNLRERSIHRVKSLRILKTGKMYFIFLEKNENFTRHKVFGRRHDIFQLNQVRWTKTIITKMKIDVFFSAFQIWSMNFVKENLVRLGKRIWLVKKFFIFRIRLVELGIFVSRQVSRIS